VPGTHAVFGEGRMKKVILGLCFCLITSNYITSQENQLDPWGIWNTVPIDINNSVIRTLKTGKYYDTGYNWIAITQDCRDIVAGDFNFPAFAIPGEFNKIEKYEKIDNSFIFFLTGDGYHRNDETRSIDFRKDVHIQIRMIFTEIDECEFEYISKTDEDGFMLSFLPKDGVIYKRYKIE
jgi:hypothetical protein